MQNDNLKNNTGRSSERNRNQLPPVRQRKDGLKVKYAPPVANVKGRVEKPNIEQLRKQAQGGRGRLGTTAYIDKGNEQDFKKTTIGNGVPISTNGLDTGNNNSGTIGKKTPIGIGQGREEVSGNENTKINGSSPAQITKQRDENQKTVEPKMSQSESGMFQSIVKKTVKLCEDIILSVKERGNKASTPHKENNKKEKSAETQIQTTVNEAGKGMRNEKSTGVSDSAKNRGSNASDIVQSIKNLIGSLSDFVKKTVVFFNSCILYIKKLKNSEPSKFVRLINTKAITVVFIVLFSLLFLSMTFAAFYLVRPFPLDDGIPNQVTMVYRFNGQKESESVSGRTAYMDGSQLYVNMSKVYSGYGMSAIGYSGKMKYTLQNGEYMMLENDSSLADINGEQVSLTGKVYIFGSDVYVPVTLFEVYCNGTNIYYNTESNALYIEQLVDAEKSNSIKTVYVEFDLIPQKAVPLAPITEPQE